MKTLINLAALCLAFSISTPFAYSEISAESPADKKPAAESTAPAPKTEATMPVKAKEARGYFLRIAGRALPLRSATIQGVNVLGSPILLLNLPINITGYLKAGANEISLDYVSDPKSELTVIVEKRTAGPKIEEIARLTVPKDESKGATAHKVLSFNMPAGETTAIASLSDSDKQAILAEFEKYYKALAEHQPEALKELYKNSLESERKLSPENARFFDKVLGHEAQLIKNPQIQVLPLDKEGLTFKIEGDKVKLFRESKKPLLESNEVETPQSKLLVEVSDPKSRVKAASDPKAAKDPQGKDSTDISGSPSIKERLVRYILFFAPSETENHTKTWSVTLPPSV